MKNNYRLGENICKPHIQQSTTIYNIKELQTFNRLEILKLKLENDQSHEQKFQQRDV